MKEKTRINIVYALQKMGVYEVLSRGRDYARLAKLSKRLSCSQFGEDLFFRDYFGDRQGLYIEIGGNHPFMMSNTFLLYRMGWRGLVVEPIHGLYARHRRFRPRDIQINAAVSDDVGELTFYEMVPSLLSTCVPEEASYILSTGKAKLLRKYSVPVVTVAELYREHLAPRAVSLLSVDTEGHDIAVLRGVDWEVMQPEIVICEANDEVKGSEITRFLAEHGYECLKVMGVNIVFRRR